MSSVFVGVLLMSILTVAVRQLPPQQYPVPFEHGAEFWLKSATQLLPWHFWHSGHVPALPVGFGFPPQCHPAFRTPTPALEAMTHPSSLTVPVPIAMIIPSS